jgi:hypothetical protein
MHSDAAGLRAGPGVAGEIDAIIGSRIDRSRFQGRAVVTYDFLPAAEILNFRAGMFDGPLLRTLQPLAAQNPEDRYGRLCRYPDYV